METPLNEGFCNQLCDWIENYIEVHWENGSTSQLPRNIPYIKQAFKVMLDSENFKDIEDIRRTCLKESRLIIPYFLFEK